MTIILIWLLYGCWLYISWVGVPTLGSLDCNSGPPESWESYLIKCSEYRSQIMELRKDVCSEQVEIVTRRCQRMRDILTRSPVSTSTTEGHKLALLRSLVQYIPPELGLFGVFDEVLSSLEKRIHQVHVYDREHFKSE